LLGLFILAILTHESSGLVGVLVGNDPEFVPVLGDEELFYLVIIGGFYCSPTVGLVSYEEEEGGLFCVSGYPFFIVRRQETSPSLDA